MYSFLRKPDEDKRPREDYNIFMAMSQRIGQDSKGNSVFVLDGNGNNTGILNHDLNEIADAYIDFLAGKEHQESEYIFKVKKSDIKIMLISIHNIIHQIKCSIR